ncbi:MAG: hypothetical protein U0T72_08995 [Chitinophagales bacterium]
MGAKSTQIRALYLVDLRDRYGITQPANTGTNPSLVKANKLGREFVIRSKRKSQAERASKNSNIPTEKLKYCRGVFNFQRS